MTTARARFAVALLTVTLSAAACGSASDEVVNAQKPPSPHLGRLVVECDYSHTLNDDPIAAPADPGFSHTHDFFGNTAVDAFTTDESIYTADDTSCAVKADGASYWAPAVFLDGQAQAPRSVDAYYRAGRGVDPLDVEVYPAGLKVIAGDAAAAEPQQLSVVGWSCGQNNTRYSTPPLCGEGSRLTLRVSFPDCWDGTRLDSADHGEHMAYSGPNGCPGSHPRAVLELEMIIQYEIWGETEGLTLASGDPITAHADFYNGWDVDYLSREIELCIHRDIVCGVAGVGS